MTIKQYMDKLEAAATGTPAIMAAALDSVEVWNSSAALGYAAAAAMAAGLDQKQTARLIDAMNAAQENMTIEEAEELYLSGNY